MKRFLFFLLAFSLPARFLLASGGGEGSSQLPFSSLLLSLAIALLLAKVGAASFEFFHLPSVTGELVAGVILGNLAFVSGGAVSFFEAFKTDPFFKILAELGVIILLFEVGLETKLHEMTKVGLSSLLVAMIGVFFPFLIGYFLCHFLADALGWEINANAPLFLGATLTATSVGITARVFKDLGCLARPEAKIVLGAAVFDDVIGLIILAVMSGIISANHVSGTEIALITGKAVLFFVGAIVFGKWIVVRVMKFLKKLRVRGMSLVFAISFAFFLSYLASAIQLAPIVGAFIAGVILEEELFDGFGAKLHVEDMIQVLSDFLVPIFFILIGMLVDIPSFLDPQILMVAGILSFAAIIGKVVCGWGALGKGLDRLSIGFGMIPRGEVGLIFASIGLSQKVISLPFYSAIIFMVVFTTFITPPLLKWSFGRKVGG